MSIYRNDKATVGVPLDRLIVYDSSNYMYFIH